MATGSVRRPLTPDDVRPNAAAKVTIPVVNYDGHGRPTLGMKTIDLLDHCKQFGKAKAGG